MSKRFQLNPDSTYQEIKLDSETGEQPNSEYDEWIYSLDIIKITAIAKGLTPRELLNVWNLVLTQIDKKPIRGVLNENI